jgi:hypothetical protein
MKLSELAPGRKLYTQLSSRVLAVLSRRVDCWAVYIDAVPGDDHEAEWPAVAAHGHKAREPLARAIVAHYFHPGFEVDLPYAD